MIANITGASGSGKTKLVNYLVSQHPHIYQRLMSYTSRYPRETEIDGIDYYFVDTLFFSNNDDLALQRERVDGLYGVKKSDLFTHDDKILLTTFPPKGVLLLEDLGLIVKSFYLSVEPEERQRRMLGRGDNTIDITNRLIADERESILERTMTVLQHRSVYVLEGNRPISEIGSMLHTVLSL